MTLARHRHAPSPSLSPYLEPLVIVMSSPAVQGMQGNDGRATLVRVCLCVCVCVCVYVCLSLSLSGYIYTHTHTHTQALLIRIQAIHTIEYTHTQTQTQTLTHTHSHTHTHTHTHRPLWSVNMPFTVFARKTGVCVRDCDESRDCKRSCVQRL